MVLSDLADNLGRYLDRVAEIRQVAEWRRQRARIAYYCGQIGFGAEVVLTAIAISGVGAACFGTAMTPWLRAMFAVAFGAVGYAMLILVTACFSRYPYARATRDIPQLEPIVAALALLAVPWAAHRLSAPISWMILGLVYGAVIDTARRRGLEAGRSVIIDPFTVSADRGDLPPLLSQGIRQPLPKPFTWDILPVRAARVFISYTRASAWSRSVTAQLHALLVERGARCFLDREAIELGVNWRATLNDSLAQSNVVICVVDQSTLKSNWAAAEVESALHRRRVAGKPEILVLVEAALFDATSDEIIPAQGPAILRALLSRQRYVEDEAQPRVIRAGVAALENIAQQLSPNVYASAAVVPGTLARLVRIVGGIPGVIITNTLMALARFGGALALVVSVLEMAGISELSSGLEAGGTLSLAAVVASFCLGSEGRQTLATRFQLRRGDALSAFSVRSATTFGWWLLLTMWLGRLAALPLAWTIVAAAIGWFTTDLALSRIAAQNQRPLLYDE